MVSVVPDVLAVVSDRIARPFNRLGATGAAEFDIYPRLSAGFGMVFLLPNFSPMEFKVKYLPLFRLF